MVPEIEFEMFCEEAFVTSEPNLYLLARVGHALNVDAFVGVEVGVGEWQTLEIAEHVLVNFGEDVLALDGETVRRARKE